MLLRIFAALPPTARPSCCHPHRAEWNHASHCDLLFNVQLKNQQPPNYCPRSFLRWDLLSDLMCSSWSSENESRATDFKSYFLLKY
eukprot:s1340_g7.t1